MSLGERVRELREARGWRQEDLAEHSRLGRGHISRIETDDYQRVSAETIARLAWALGIEPGDLLKAAGYPVVTLIDPSFKDMDAEIRAFLAFDWDSLSTEHREWVKSTIRLIRQQTKRKNGVKGTTLITNPEN